MDGNCPICGTHGVPCDCGDPDVDSDGEDLEKVYAIDHNSIIDIGG